MAVDRELGDTPKPKPRVSKRQKQNDEFKKKQVINLLNQDDDDIDLYFQSLAKKLKRTLTEGDIDNVMDEINGVVSRHVRQARIKKDGVDLCYLAYQVNLSINRSRWLSNRLNILSKMSTCLCHQYHHCNSIVVITT